MIRKLLDTTYRLIEKNKYLAQTKPFVDAADTFFYGMPDVTDSAPHIRDNVDLKRYMIAVVVALMPAAFMGFYLYGVKILLFFAVSYIFGIGTEAIFSIIRKEDINEGAFVTCFLYPLTLPPQLELHWVALGIVFGIVFGKEIFGGTGKNLFNPALVGRCFLFLCFPLLMTNGKEFQEPATGMNGGLGGVYSSASLVPDDGNPAVVYTATNGVTITGATPLGVRKVKLVGDTPEETAQLRKQYEKEMLPKLVVGNVSGSIGETSVLMLLIPGLLLMFSKIANWRTVLATLGSAAVLSLIMNMIDPVNFAGPLFTLASGGMMLGAVYMATDPVSGPITSKGRWYYGIMIGILTVLIRGVSGYAEGIMFAILLANIFAPTIDYLIITAKYKPKEAVA